MYKEKYLINEQQIIEGCLVKDPTAQKSLFNQLAPRMLAICSRYCQNREDAKDAMHDGFIKIFKHFEKYKGESKLETWITRIMIFTAIDQFKKSIKYKLVEDNESVYTIGGIDHADNDYLEPEINKQALYDAIQSLPDGYRIVFSLYAIDGFTHKQIAKELGISEGTSKSQYARARKQLKLTLSHHREFA
ncbi:MAG: RNA polymerase sigma factor [Bacteroidia bacterium]